MMNDEYPYCDVLLLKGRMVVITKSDKHYLILCQNILLFQKLNTSYTLQILLSSYQDYTVREHCNINRKNIVFIEVKSFTKELYSSLKIY